MYIEQAAIQLSYFTWTMLLSYFIFALLVVYARGKPINNQETQPQQRNLECSKSAPTVTCPQLKNASSYGLSIEQNEFKANEEIKVKVYTTSCPMSEESPLPRWYQLEAFWSQENNNEESTALIAGQLKSDYYQRDLYHCENASRVLFYPCEAVSFDFPRRYTWKAPKSDSGFLSSSVCFRLTLMEENSTSCDTFEKCIEYSNESTVTAKDYEFFSIPIDIDEDSDYYEELKAVELVSNTDNVQQAIEYPSDCLESREYHKSRNSSWIPQCDCKGYYRLVQCKIEREPESLICWCSSEYGSQLSQLQTTVTDCSKFELNCV